MSPLEGVGNRSRNRSVADKLRLMLDPESVAALQSIAGDAAQIPPELRDRIRGESVGEMKADARRLAKQLGIVEPPPRDERGKFAPNNAAMNDIIRGGR